MGNSSDSGGGHWSDSSNVLRDSERIRTRPMPKPSKSGDGPSHVDLKTVEGEKHVGNGFHVGGEGPNAKFGVKNDDDVTQLDAQVNLGGVSVSHKSDDHEYKVGLSKGWGGGVRVYKGEKPGGGVTAGPLSVDVRDKKLNEPVSKETEEMMLLGFGE